MGNINLHVSEIMVCVYFIGMVLYIDSTQMPTF